MKIVSVVLPTYNEQANIIATVDKVLAQKKNLPGWEIEIVIADDIRSSDGTDLTAKKLSQENHKVHFIKVDAGLGVGLIEGQKYALNHFHPDVLAQLDADGQVGVDVLVKLVKATPPA